MANPDSDLLLDEPMRMRDLPRPASAKTVILINLITASGLVIGLAGVALVSPVLLLLSSAFDALDGYVARRLLGATLFGARFDWAVDTALSYAIVYRVVGHWPILAVVCAAALVLTQATASYCEKRCSGRTVATLLAVAWIWWPA